MAKKTEQECYDHAVEATSNGLVYRHHINGSSVDEIDQRGSVDVAIVRGAIAGALYAVRGHYATSQQAADVAEFIASAIERELTGVGHERLNNYDNVYSAVRWWPVETPDEK